MDPSWMQYINAVDKSQRRTSRNRACEECRRKKTRCDMRQPTCSLCGRIGINCVYPAARRQYRRRHAAVPPTTKSPSKGNADSNLTDQRERSSPRSSIAAPSQTNRSQTNDSGRSPDTAQVLSYHGNGPDGESLPRSPAPLIDQAEPSGISAAALGISDFDLPLSVFALDSGEALDNDFFSSLSFDHASTSVAMGSMDNSWFNAGGSCSPQALTADGKGNSPSKSNVSGDGRTLSSRIRPGIEAAESTLQAPEDQRSLLSIHVPAAVANHLVELFFDRVQGFLPLLHRPKFYLEIFEANRDPEERYQDLDAETALLLNGMFALSARFSAWEEVWTSGPRGRGEQFAKRAKALDDQISQRQQQPSLRVLQGKILVTYYELTQGPSFQAWLATGSCCRMAYGLSLHHVDRNPASDKGIVEGTWLEQEEKRRAWWAIFQMDNFASVIAARPFNIDCRSMDVMLPVGDDEWFSNRPIPSVRLPTRGPSETWQTLQGCENQDSYAWFLVCNDLIRSALQEFEKRERSTPDLMVLQSALHCFALGLPAKFSMSATNMAFGEENYVEKNWAICTAILLQAAHIFVSIALQLESTPGKMDQLQNESIKWEQLYDGLVETCSQHINEHMRVMRLWPPDFMSLASPLVTCALIGPAAVHAAGKPAGGGDSSDVLHYLGRQFLEYSLQRFEQYWGLGTSMKDLLKSVRLPPPVQTGLPHDLMSAWIQGLMPGIVQMNV